MNLNYLPLIVTWGVLALAVLALFIRRQVISNHEDDSLHVLHGALNQQVSMAQKLDQIDKWGKILTVVTVIFGLLLAAAYVYGQFVGRASIGG